MERIPRSQHMQTFLEGLYDRYKIPLLRIIHKYIGLSEECEDIFHEVFIRIIKNAEILHSLPQPKMEAYLVLIARGVSIDYLKEKQNNAKVDLADETIFALMGKRDRLKAFSDDPYRWVDLSLMMEKLSHDEQVLLIGKYYLGLSINDLVEIIGGTPTGIRARLYRAKKRVFNEWSKSGLNMEDFVNG